MLGFVVHPDLLWLAVAFVTVMAGMFDNAPDPSQLYIFPAPVPGPIGADKIAGATEVPQRFSHRMRSARLPVGKGL